MNKSDTTVSSYSSSHSESTKTDSSGAQSVDTRKEEDFTKDNSLSPIDLECHIQRDRILKLLNETIYKTQICLTLLELVHERKTLAQFLKTQHLEDIYVITEQYENPLFSSSLLNISAIEDLQKGDMSLKNRLNPELGHLIYILFDCPKIKPRVEELANEMKLKYMGDNLNQSAPASLLYLLELEHFREQMAVQMELTAAEELGIKIKTRRLEESNADLLAQIQEYTTSLKDEAEAFEKSMLIRQATIAKLEQELQACKQSAKLKLKKQILDSERQMVLLSRAHAVKGEILRQEEFETTNAYEVFLKNNLLTEKKQRARRIKVETQLLSWVQKYDTEMSDKQVDLDELIKQYDDELERVEKLELELAEQDKEYLPLMEEREKEYHAELEEKMNKCLVEHAARVIQVAWRDTLANRAEKKKLKKLQKKLIAQREAAERAAEAAARKAAAAARRAQMQAKAAALEAKKAEKKAQVQAKMEAAAAARAAEKEKKKNE